MDLHVSSWDQALRVALGGLLCLEFTTGVIVKF